MITLAHGLDHTRGAGASHAEGHSTVLDIGTRDIELDGRYLVEGIDAGGTLGIVFGRTATDVDNHPRVDILNLRIDVGAEIIDTLVLQPHTVEHTRSDFGHTGIVVALAWTQGGSFDDNAANLMQRHEVGKLQSIPESARCGHYRVGEFQVIYLYI